MTGEPAAQAGATVLAARAMTEGTANHDAVSLIEASERLGAELSADAGWETFAVSVDVPRSRIAPALALLAEVALQPSFPLRGGGAAARGAAQRPAPGAGRATPARRACLRGDHLRRWRPPIAGPWAATSRRCRASAGTSLVARHASLMRPSRATLLLVGDLTGIDARRLAEDSLGDWAESGAHEPARGVADAAATGGRRIVVVDRPGSPQSELRIGHVGVRRRNPDFHAIGGPQRAARWSLRVAPERAAARAEGLHLRRPLHVRHARRCGPVRGAHRGPDGVHGALRGGDPGRAAAHP